MRIGFALALAAVAALGLPAAAHAQDGEAAFKRQCTICHATQAGQNKVGPSMAGIVGRKAGTIQGFQYSDAMKGSNITWDIDTLSKYIADPKAVVPNGKMVFAGVKKPEDVQLILEYIKTLK
jgi:cytochrome c